MKSRKRKRLLIVLITGVLAFAACFVFFNDSHTEPTYNSRSVSEWLEQRGTGPFPDSSFGNQGSRAIRAIGTNALPVLLRTIAYEPNWLLRVVMANSQKLPNFVGGNPTFVQWLYRANTLPRIAVEAFADLGPTAVPAIPDLVHLIQSTNRIQETRSRAMAALVRIGPDAVPAIFGVVSNLNKPSELWMLTPIQQMGQYADAAIPALLPQLQNTNPLVVLCLAKVLRERGMDYKPLVPAIAKCLDDPRSVVRVEAATMLKLYGGLAQAALPALVRTLKDTNTTVRSTAAGAIMRIDPGVLPEEFRIPVTSR